MFGRPRTSQEDFFARHADYAVAVARPLLRDEEAVREVVQRVFADSLTWWDGVARARDPKQWLRQAVRNQCWRFWKERHRAPVPAARDDDAGGDVMWGAHLDDPEEALSRAQLREAFLRAFYALDEGERAVIQLRYLTPELAPAADDEPTLDQIARELSTPKITVRRRLDRARAKLRASLDALGFDLPTDQPGSSP